MARKLSGETTTLRVVPQRPLLVAVAAAALVAGALLVSGFLTDRGLRYSLSPAVSRTSTSDTTSDLAEALLFYATTNIVPQQNRGEIRLAFDVLQRRSPCNFLVFGLGRDSQMWSAFNVGGTTVFLEEDPKWYSMVLKDNPKLRAHHVKYRTKLSQANELLQGYKNEAECQPGRVLGGKGLKENGGCRLALVGLPDEIYDTEWDVVMVDAPKGYYPAAPGRMGAIYSAAVMARGRQGAGETDVFLHDVDRMVEKAYAREFLCDKYRVGGSGRLWHFRIPPANDTSLSTKSFC